MSPEDQLAQKIRLENIFKPEIIRSFNVMISDFKIKTGIGQAFNAANYIGMWENVIDKHFKRVQKSFLGVNKQATIEEEEREELLLLALLTWKDENKVKSAKAITKTNIKDVEEALRKARLEFQEEGVIPTDRELALAASVILTRKFKGRVSSIAMTETQKAAESTKFIDAEVDSGLTPTILGGVVGAITRVMKTWLTMRDNRVRRGIFNHVAAEGQRVLLTEPFIVSGQLLNFPGDMSLGASIGNVANCRCVATYS